jgi:hypothetical protein
MTDIMDHVGRLADILEEAGTAVAGGDDGEPSTYRPMQGQPGFDKVPWSAYFYYVGKAEAGAEERPVTFYQYLSHHGPIASADLKDLITQLALNARRDVAVQNPQPITSVFQWKRKSYIIMLVDDPGFAFDKRRAISITLAEGPDLGENFSFFDGVDFDDIVLPNSNGGTECVTAVCVTNHMKRDAAGNDIGKESQRFSTRLSPPIQFVFARVSEMALLLGDGGFSDDGGTNMGPPVPPPAP